MHVKLILAALTEAASPFFRPIKYALFPPLGLATLAGYLSADDAVTLVDEHVETLLLDDEPDLVGIEVYITSARRSYEIADHYRRRGVFVVLGGLHVTSLRKRPPGTRMQSSWDRGRTPGRAFLPTSATDARNGATSHRSAL